MATIDGIRALAAKFHKEAENETKGGFFKLVNGDNQIRILPGKDNNPFTEIYSIFRGKQGSLNVDMSKPNCLTTYVKQLYAKFTSDADKQNIGTLNPKPRYYFQMLDRSESNASVKILGVSKTVAKELVKLLMNEDHEDILDPKVGRDIIFTLDENKQNPMLNRTSILPRTKPTPIVKGDVDEFMGKVPSMENIFKLATDEELEEHLEEWIQNHPRYDLTSTTSKKDISEYEFLD